MQFDFDADEICKDEEPKPQHCPPLTTIDLHRLPLYHSRKPVFMTITTREVSHVTIVDLNGRITLGDETGKLREAIRELIASGKKKIVLNLIQVDYIDSSGVGIHRGEILRLFLCEIICRALAFGPGDEYTLPTSVQLDLTIHRRCYILVRLQIPKLHDLMFLPRKLSPAARLVGILFDCLEQPSIHFELNHPQPPASHPLHC